MNFLTRSVLLPALALMMPLVSISAARAQVDEGAKTILVESANAIKNAKGLTFKTKRYATGALAGLMDCSAEVKLIRESGKPTIYALTGQMKSSKDKAEKFDFYTDGSTTSWLDWEKNVFFERPATDRQATLNSGNINLALEKVFTDIDPFARELASPKIERAGTETINGEVCDLVSLSNSKEASVVWAISAIDRLPRKLTQSASMKEQSLSMIFEVSDLKPAKLVAKDLALTMPTNFTKDVSAAPTPIVNPTKEQPVVPVNTKLGLDVGTAIPSFSTKDSAGKAFADSTLKGHVAVLAFMSPTIKPSVVALEDIAALNEQYKSQSVMVVSLVCREQTADTVKNMLSQKQMTHTLIPQADALMAPFKVVGFPSTYIIKADGTVAAFFQGQTPRDQIAKAIDAALAK